MKPRLRATSLRTSVAVLAFAAAVGSGSTPTLDAPGSEREEAERRFPNDWFLTQRAWPHDDIRQSSRLAAAQQARVLREEASLRGGPSWSFAGPTNVGGRIADIACHPTDPNICWVGAAEGGVMKTTDGGTTWTPTMDFESSLSIGDVTLDPTNPDVLYVGTGEPNGGGGSVTYGGTGVFRTTDGGSTWANVGLPESRYIGRIAVDPSNPSRVFAAVVGSMFSKNVERGVYRSTDAGAAWTQVLALNDSTGAVDVVVHPTNSNVVYAATWERTRRPDNIYYGGNGSGVWRSSDGGDTWTELTTGLPAGPTVGRIGLAIAPTNPDVLYAIYAEADPGAFVGLFKTTNGGTSWTQTNDGSLFNMYATFGWWFGNVRVSPTNANTVFAIGYEVWRSTSGGTSWSNVGSSMHVDHHAMDFAPNGHLYEGNDGGMYKSTNGGTVWAKLPNLPVTQFYAIDVDQVFPLRLYGGAQDNGTTRTMTGAFTDWVEILGGDGFTPLVDPVNDMFLYAESQYGALSRSTNGGSTFNPATSGLAGRINWSMPVILNPSAPATLYCGTDRVFRSTNRAATWSAISPDLTNGPGSGNRVFGTVTTLAVAPTNSLVIWAGTDDANLWVTQNGGTNWTEVGAALPQRWVTRVAVDPTAANISYVTISGFRWDEPLPHVFRSTDFGASWADISGNLPEAPVNDLVIDPLNPATLFVATDFGVYRSTDVGGTWAALGGDLPNVVVSDLRLHAPTRTLVAGTYGRSMWKFDLNQPTSAEIVAGGEEPGPRLDPIAPNPFAAGSATIRFTLPRAADVSLRVVDVAGRSVATLEAGRRAAGTTTVQWGGRDGQGRLVASGVYFVRLEADGLTRTQRLTIVRP